MHIIKQIKVDRDAVDAAMIDAIKLAYSTEAATEHLRIQEAAEEAQAARNAPKDVPGLGRLVAVMPERDYFRLIHKYGHEEVHSKGFLRDFQRLNPEMAASKL